MKILMIGRGVIATIYGWALGQAGNEVEFYVRPGRAASYGPVVDLDLVDARKRPWGQPVAQKLSPHYREALEPDHDFDLIVVSVAHNRLADALEFVRPRLGTATVLIFGNVWAEPSAVVDGIPADQVAWGFPGAGGGFTGGGALRAAILPSVIFGTFGQPPTDRERRVRELFRSAGFRIKEAPDFRGWLWIHFIMDAGLHAQGLRLGSLSELIGKRKDLREALLTSRELLPLLQARGIDLRRHRAAVLGLHAPTGLSSTAMSWVINHVASARLSLEAHTDGLADEPRAICIDTLAEARRLGVAVPRLEAAVDSFAQN
jgi:2-dehydropantoate 2-reductase